MGGTTGMVPVRGEPGDGSLMGRRAGGWRLCGGAGPPSSLQDNHCGRRWPRRQSAPLPPSHSPSSCAGATQSVEQQTEHADVNASPNPCPTSDTPAFPCHAGIVLQWPPLAWPPPQGTARAEAVDRSCSRAHGYSPTAGGRGQARGRGRTGTGTGSDPALLAPFSSSHPWSLARLWISHTAGLLQLPPAGPLPPPCRCTITCPCPVPFTTTLPPRPPPP